MTDRQLFKETFSCLHASEDTLTEVLKMAREQEYKNTRKRHPMRAGAIIALAAALLMGTALAAVGAHGELYRIFFGTQAVENAAAASGENGTVTVEAHESTYEDDVKGPITFDIPGYQLVQVDEAEADRLLGAYVKTMDDAYTVDGVTVTMLGYIEDEAGTCRLYYSMEDPNGFDYETYDENGYTRLGRMDWGGAVSAGSGRGAYIDTAKSTDTTVYVCVADVADLRPDIRGEEVRIYGDRGGAAQEEYVPPVEDLFITADTLVPAETLEDDDFRILVSPMGAKVTSLHQETVWVGDEPIKMGLEVLYLSITMKDGTEYVVEEHDVTRNSTYICGSADGDSETFCFNRLIDPADIASVTVSSITGTTATIVK